MDFIVEPMEHDPGGTGCGVNCTEKCTCNGREGCIVVLLSDMYVD